MKTCCKKKPAVLKARCCGIMVRDRCKHCVRKCRGDTPRRVHYRKKNVRIKCGAVVCPQHHRCRDHIMNCMRCWNHMDDWRECRECLIVLCLDCADSSLLETGLCRNEWAACDWCHRDGCRRKKMVDGVCKRCYKEFQRVCELVRGVCCGDVSGLIEAKIWVAQKEQHVDPEREEYPMSIHDAIKNSPTTNAIEDFFSGLDDCYGKTHTVSRH